MGALGRLASQDRRPAVEATLNSEAAILIERPYSDRASRFSFSIITSGSSINS